jgi:6-phosphogluconolactonase
MRPTSLLFASPIALFASATPLPRSSQLGFYVALQSSGILEIDFDPSKPANNSLSISKYNTNAGYQVNWITGYRDRIYSISRSHYPNASIPTAGVFAFEQPNAGSAMNLTLLNSRTTYGNFGVYLDVSPDGRTLAAASYNPGSVAIYPLSPDGVIDAPTYNFQYSIPAPGPGTNGSQTTAETHTSVFDSSGRYLFVAEHGGDRLFIYSHNGPSNVNLLFTHPIDPGSGPRHMAFAPRDSTSFYVYLISDLENCVRTLIFSYSTSSTQTSISQAQIISTLGLGTGMAARTRPNNDYDAAEIAISNDGRFVYASNRATQTLEPDTIAIFARDADDGTLTYLTQTSTQGKIPRTFALSPDPNNRYVAVANELTQDITVLERDCKSGMLGIVVGRIVVGENDMTLTKGPLGVLWKGW